MKTFDDVWQDILNVIKDDNIVYTLRDQKKNVIDQIVAEGLLVTTDRHESQLVKQEWIKDAWETLLDKKTIVANDLTGEARHRSSFIMALLAKLKYIRSAKLPNTLYLNL